MARPGIRNAMLVDWIARAAVGTVFALNVSCALLFIMLPERYAAGFEVDGVPGRMVVQGFGILFLMWNTTYPPVLLRPSAQMTLFAVVLVQQMIGLVGEMWLWLGLPAGHPGLRGAGLRFIVFDGLGLVLMAIAYMLLRSTRSPRILTGQSPKTQEATGGLKEA